MDVSHHCMRVFHAPKAYVVMVHLTIDMKRHLITENLSSPCFVIKPATMPWLLLPKQTWIDSVPIILYFSILLHSCVIFYCSVPLHTRLLGVELRYYDVISIN
jgi:hypothetical protein